MTTIVITIADPAHPPVRAMVEELDAYLVPLYPAESNHLLDIARPSIAMRVAAQNAAIPVCARPRISAWMSCVPS